MHVNQKNSQTKEVDVSEKVVEKSNIPQLPQVADLSASWKVYQNKEYGFEIKYPKDFILNSQNKGYINLQLIDNTFYKNTNLIKTSVTVFAQQEGETSVYVEHIQDEFHTKKIGQRTVNGVIFNKYQFIEEATSNQYEEIIYDLPCKHKVKCYAYQIVLNIHSANIDVFDPGTISKFNRTKLLDIFEQIVSTFRLIN